MMDNLFWGLQVTVVGMGLVFGLLALLWGLLVLVLWWDRAPAARRPGATGAAAEEVPRVVAEGSATPGGPEIDAELVAAIMVATLTHKAIRRREAAPVMRTAWPGSLLHASRWVASGRTLQNRNWRREGK